MQKHVKLIQYVHGSLNSQVILLSTLGEPKPFWEIWLSVPTCKLSCPECNTYAYNTDAIYVSSFPCFSTAKGSQRPSERMAMNNYEDHSISSSHADETDERRSTISVSPEASVGEEPFSFFGLLCYVDTVDWLLMALGTIGSIIHGIAFPVGYLLLGKALDAFGTNINDQEGMVHALYKVNLLNR